MVLNLVFVLLVSSVVIASGSLCKDAGNVTIQDPKYFKFNLGFFYIHGLTNGESVVLYKFPEVDNVHVEYTFINDDCLYETRSYNILENGTFVDNVKNLKELEDFSISKTLSFVVDDKAVELKYEINKNGYVLNHRKEEIAFETLSQKIKDTFEDKCSISKELSHKDFSDIEFSGKESLEINYLKNGRFFYQGYNGMFINGLYAFKTSNGDYYAMDYSMFNEKPDYFEFQVESYTVKDTEHYSEDVGAHVKDGYITLCFKSTGISKETPKPNNINFANTTFSSPGQQGINRGMSLQSG